MREKNTTAKTVNEYMAALPADQCTLLQKMRTIIKEAAPKADEVINYSMPAFKGDSVLVWYAIYKEHLGLYPTAAPIQVFKDDLAKYKTSKGAIQFPLDKPLPVTLIKKIVKYRVKEDAEKAMVKKKK